MRKRTGHTFLRGWVLLWCVTATLYACKSDTADTTGLESLTITTSAGREIVYRVEIADDDAERTRGLMYRSELPEDQGMLFDFMTSRQVSFWMKNTYISLDMLFIDAGGKIAKIADHTEPMSTHSISSEVRVRFVLEVNAGQAEKQGIREGDRVIHERIQ